VVDTVAPANLAFAQKPAATTTEHTAHFEFSADGATAFQCKLDTGAFASCTSPKDLDTLGEGSHTFTVRALDAAGNSVELAHTWTVEAPVVENVVPASGGTVGTAAADAVPTPGDPVIVRVTVPAGDTGGAVSIQEQASATGDAPSGFSFFGEQLVIEAPARTAANPLRISLLIDAATLAAAGVTKDTIEITRDNVVVEECTTADGTATPDPCVSERKALADGDVEIVVLTSHASKWNFAKDSKKPDTTITGGPTGETTATDASFGLTSDEAATFECKLDGGAYAPCDATKSFSGLAVGDHTFSARAKDATGNVDDSPATRTWKVAAPPVTTTDPTPTTTTTPTTPTTPPTTPVTPKDTTAPIVSLKAAKQKIKAVLAKGLALTAGCDEICAMKITVTIDAKTAKRLKLGKKAVTAGSATASKSGKVTVKLSRKVAAKLKKAKSVLLTVKVAAVDAAGNPQTKTLKVTLKR
jgi:hypothetical protein